MRKDIVLPISLILLVSIGFIAYFTIDQINSTNRLRKLSSELSSYSQIPTVDLLDPETRRKIAEKINQYELIEQFPVKHLDPKEEEEQQKQSTLRTLADSNIFEDVALVDPIETEVGSLAKWIIKNIKQFSPEIVVYPYAFDFNYVLNETEETKHFSQGSYIALNPASVDPYQIGLKTDSTVSVQKARALYDTDVAILSIEFMVTTYSQDLFQDAVDWCTYFQTNIGKGTCYATYEDFYAVKKKNPNNAFITKVNETDVAGGKLLTEEGLPRFGILIIPDFKLGVQSYIKTLLTEKGISNLVSYFNAGGIIIATGKSGYLMEDFGLVTPGSYDPTKLLNSDTANRQINIKGCENSQDKKYSSTDDFRTQLLCSGINSNSHPCLSTTFRMKNVDTRLKTLLSIDPSSGNLVYTDSESGISQSLSEEDKKFTPLILHRINDKKGELYLLNFNPLYYGGNKNIVLNVLVSAWSKEMYMVSKVNMDINSTAVPDLPIPAGEAGVELEINTLFHNLNDKKINEFTMYIFLPENFGWTEVIPQGCTPKTDFSNIPKQISVQRTFTSSNSYLYCKIGSVDTYEKKYFKTAISVLNYKATQEKYEILILEPIVSYTDSNGKENILAEHIRVTAEAAPVLRVAINPDPSSFYPVEGRGQYVDNVVKIENKEESDAHEVEYVGLIPIVSPLTDGDDQRVLRWNLQIFVDYYNKNNFEVPFTADDAQDYIFTGWLSGKGAVIVAEWDSPALPVKEILTTDENGNLGQDVDLTGINLGMITITSTTQVIRQVNYRKSDRFYKLASQRLMVFVDTSTPEGAKTLYGSYNKIPDEWKDKVNRDRAKKEFIFTRSDIYFYDNENYCNPPGIKEEHVFSIDNYIPYKKNQDKCAKVRGEAKSSVNEKGFFTNFEEDKKDVILKPAIWTNEMFQYCDLTVIDPTSETAIKNVFGNTESLRPVHYTVPNVEPSITQPGQIYGFIQETEYKGYLETYPSVKFIYVHSLTYVINTEKCLYGGKIEIDLGGYKLNSIDDVTLSPDQIAFYKTEYINNKIIAYFRRGLMSNEQFGKDMTITINIENLSSTSAINLKVTLYQMKYDISYPPDYERYFSYGTETLTFNYVSVFSYPALELKTKLNRTLGGYETMEPFSRYGVYIQEIGHRTVFGIAETHHQTNPGMTGSGDGFSMISNLGISSIPFLEYVTAGKGQVIPAGTSTSRATWKDVWGRTWHQPLRTVFPDVPPIPPPLKNFMMTTTYEILRNGKQIYEWPSDENAQIHLHVKFLNNYPKYFEITRCKENGIKFVPNKLMESHSREYSSTCDADLGSSEMNGNKMMLSKGGFASYGKCFLHDDAIVGGESVNNFKDKLKEAILCADSVDAKEIAACEERLKDITTLHRMPDNWDTTKKWNYSPLVESYYPKDYINEEDMWQLTHIDYDDNAMDKAYKYHMDNLLPNYDNGIIKPHNTIAIPIYKGVGYNITYNKETSMNYHGTTKKGWWGDNLQNKDDTLLAGQAKSNLISVDKQCLISTWIEGKDLVGSKRTGSTENVKKIVEDRNKNIYVCLYNRKRPQHTPDNNINYYTANVNQNNIVPIIVNLDKDDKRLTNYECTGEQYTPDNLYQMTDNYLETPTSKDYLYFAANLRGQAKEAFNVLMNLNYFPKIKYEGMIKINEGGRFVYWNPANGPNSFLIVDDPVSIVNAKRNDIEIKNELFPLRVPTFKAVVYHLYTFYDENKINQEWPFTGYYANSYGFGDVAISVYVGGVRKSKALVNPGETTYCKIVIMNNCGFDWNMLGKAIEFEYKGSKPISANDLLFNLKHTIQKPLKYNFLEWTVGDDYKDYITIEPSDHNIEVAPEFFDFENINVVTIRDGFKGEYFLKINVTKNFPDDLRGKPIEIKMGIKPEYFDHFPGTDSDPIKSYHNYVVKMPSVYIGVPFKSGNFTGKVLYSSAQATNLDMKFNIGIDWSIEGIKYIDDETIDKIRENSMEQDFTTILNETWNKMGGSLVKYTSKTNGDIKTITIDGLATDYQQFPKSNIRGIDIAKVSFLVKSNVAQIRYGYSTPITDVKMDYKDWISKKKTALGEKPQIYAEGAWLDISYTRTLMDEIEKGKYVESPNQLLTLTDEGVMKVQFKLTNNGNAISWNTLYEIVIEKNLTYIGDVSGEHSIEQITNSEGQTVLRFNYRTPINPGESKGGIIYLRFKKYIDSLDGVTEEEMKKMPTYLKIAKQASATFDLTNKTGENQVTEYLRKALTFDYTNKDKTYSYVKLVITGRRSNPSIQVVPVVKHVKNEKDSDVLLTVGKLDLTDYSKARKLADIDDGYKYVYIVENYPLGAVTITDRPHYKETDYDKHVVMYTVYIRNPKTGDKSSGYIKYEQENLGISIYETILIIASVILFALAGLLAFKGYKNMQLIKNGGLDKKVRNTQLEKLISE